jgi:hypothetical protein
MGLISVGRQTTFCKNAVKLLGEGGWVDRFR